MRPYIVAVVVAALVGTTIAASAVHLLGGSTSTAAPSRCPSAPTPPTARTPIQHVFFLIKENHAFENYFGTLPGVAGYPPNGTFPPTFTAPPSIRPYALSTNWTGDLPHDRQSYLAAVEGGRMDDFVAQAAAAGYANANQAVGYYSAAQLPDYFAYARDYTLDDRFFGGALGPTLPNRLFDLGLTGTSWSTDLPPPASAVQGPTLPTQFQGAGLPWAYYYSGPSEFLAPTLVPQIAGSACMMAKVLPMAGLASALRGPDPPAFAYIDPSNDLNASEHPPANVTFGEEWTVAVLDQIFSSPIAGSTAVFLFYDESGGFWDPVPPPSEPPIGDGLRVPLLVFSPYTPKGWIDHQELDPANLLHWVEWNWDLPPLDARIANASLPTGMFNFSAIPRAPLILPTPVALPGGEGTDRAVAKPVGTPAYAPAAPAAAATGAGVSSTPRPTTPSCRSGTPRAPTRSRTPCRRQARDREGSRRWPPGPCGPRPSRHGARTWRRSWASPWLYWACTSPPGRYWSRSSLPSCFSRPAFPSLGPG